VHSNRCVGNTLPRSWYITLQLLKERLDLPQVLLLHVPLTVNLLSITFTQDQRYPSYPDSPFSVYLCKQHAHVVVILGILLAFLLDRDPEL
jgi:hypothetical protein